MAKIPTFNNLDLMESVRIQSLNPTIEAVNDLVDKVEKTPKFIGPFKENELARWDSTTKNFEPSGVLAENGEIHMAPSTLIFGNHRMSSSIENVVFTNHRSGRTYSPLWQEHGVNQGAGYVRVYGKIERAVRVQPGNIDVVNPVNASVRIDKDSAFLGGTFTLTRAATNVVITIIDPIDGTILWRQGLGDLQAGSNTVTFTAPLEVRKDFVYSIGLSSSDGSDVVAKSNASTGFSWEVSRVPWVDREIALKANMNLLFKDAKLEGNDLVFTPYGSTALPVRISLPSTSGGGSGSQTIPEGYVYNGGSIPQYPDDPKISYFVTITGNADDPIHAPGSKELNGRQGIVLLVKNERTSKALVVTPDGSDTIDGTTGISLGSGEFGLYVRGGSDWKKVISGWVPASYNILTQKLSNTMPEFSVLGDLESRVAILEGSALSRPVFTLDTQNKVITAEFTNGGKVIKQDIDLKPLFQKQPKPPATAYQIMFGFTGSQTPTEADITGGDNNAANVKSLAGYQVNMVRQNKVPKYLYFWKDDRLPNVVTFQFGGFPDYWTSQKLSIGGVDGTLYISDNQTASNNITYGVNV